MALLIGQPIDARELEQATSKWSPLQFASMCDAVAWTASGRAFQEIPSFTSRVNVKDGGVDAEWDVNIPDDNREISTPILGHGWNVFQYKQRDLIAQKRKPVFSRLKSSLIGALKEVEENFTKRPDRYVLFVNLDLTGKDKAELKTAILKGSDAGSSIQIEIIGAGELAALLNDNPHLRAAFFTPLAFKSWKDAYDAHRSQKRFSSHAELIGRESELQSLTSLLDNPRVRAIVLSGPHDMGKSRLALEATKHRPYDVAVALDPRSTGLADYRTLCTARSKVICIVEDPELEALRSLVGEALSMSGLKLLITLPTAQEATDLVYGFDDHVVPLHLAPLSEESGRKLLQTTGQTLDYGIQDWIRTQAGGVPGIILAAALVGTRIRQDSGNFRKAVGAEFERRVAEELGETALKTACLFSVLTHVGVSGPHASELRAICQRFGDNMSPHEALNCLPKLEAAGLAKRVGSYVEVTLPLLANYLVARLLQGRALEMFALFADLDEAGQLRFIKRLAQTESGDLGQFWDELFASDGPLGTLHNILKRPYLLRLVAGTVPDRAMRVLEHGLLDTSKVERLAITDDRRRELLWALDQLLFRMRTSGRALRLIWLLAETENEKWSNNATGVLEECFHPLHSQMPLPLDERISLIRERLAQNPAVETKLTAVKAIQGAFKGSRSIHLRRSSSGEPLDTWPSLTRPQVFEYFGSLVEILISIAQEENEAAEAALDALPECIAELIFQGLLEKGLQYFRQVTDWAIQDRQGLDVSRFAAILSRVRDFLVQQLGKPNPMDRRSEYERAIAELAELGASLERASFSIRLKRWAGKGSYRVSSEWKQVEEQLRVLAKEAIQIPQRLTQDLIQWLLTASAKQARAFFHLLGEEDQTFHFRSTIEGLAKDCLGSRAFAPYFAGWAKRDLTGAESRLDELAESDAVCAIALLEATSLLQPTPQGLKRVKKAAEQDPEYAAAILGRWIDRLTATEFKELLQIIAGADLRRASAAIDLLGSWIYHNKDLNAELREFAWRCIEHGPSKSESRSPAWQFDELAAELTEIDPDSGFQKFKQLFMTSSRSLDWEPLDMDGGDRWWWKVLRKKDRRLLFQILLDVSHMNETIQQTVSWRLKELLDQQEDADDLLAVVGHEIENARIVARWLVGSKDNFWKIAFLLLNTFPSDQELFDALTAAATDMETMISGPASTFYETRKAEAKKRLEDPSTPAAVRPWLRELIEHLGSEVSTHLVWEYDRDVNDLRRYIHDKDSSQRIWAIGRVLKYGDPKDIKQLLTVEDIEEALPQVDLPDQRRKMFERLLPGWKHGS